MNHINYLKGAGLKESPSGLNPGPNDVLIVVDMQNDFVPQRLKDGQLIGGAFAVDDGDSIIPGIAHLINACHANGATVVYTRDYHPHDHVSFIQNGGPFPPHCLQGGVGSYIVDELSAVANVNDIISYKAFLPCVDSFGALPYTANNARNRISHTSPCSLFGTGAYALRCSGRLVDNIHDPNAPPDINSWKGPRKNSSESLLHILRQLNPENIYVCGLAMEYCVLDTAINLREKKFNNVHILLSLTRASAANPEFTKNILNSTVAREGKKFRSAIDKYGIGTI